jgi:GT2 family glycosyltransferase
MTKINLSLIIASYNGYRNIQNLLDSILSNKFIPKEIIIVCFNNQYNKYFYYSKKYIKKLNIKIYKSNIKNQIVQRQIGLNKCKMDYILQLDDDIIIGKNTLQLIFNELKKNHYKTILSANLKTSDGNPADFRWRKNYNKYTLFRFMIFLLNNFKKVKPYSIISSGKPIPGLNIQTTSYEWLNSSLCFHRSALKDYEFFSSKGKAYYEDVYTSHVFFKKGYNLKKIINADIYHPKTQEMNLSIFFKSIINQYKILIKFKKNIFLFILDIFFFTLIFIFKKK